VDRAAARPPASAGPAVAAATPRSAYDVLWDSGLLNVLALARRDLGALLRWPVVYLAGALVIVVTSVLGYRSQLVGGGAVTMAPVFGAVALAMAVFVPVVTMRLLAAEARGGTLELLLASPVRDWELVVGKWLAGLAFFCAASAFTLVYVVLIAVQQPAGGRADAGAVLAGYLGLVLVGAAWVAIGLLVSGLTRNLVVAAVGGAVALLALQYLLGVLGGILSPPLSDLLVYAGAAEHARSFGHGQVVLRDVLYFVSLIAGALFLCVQVVGARRQR